MPEEREVIATAGAKETDRETEMRALTVKQPWASLIIGGGKDIENRDWRTSYTGIVAIHSSAKMSAVDMEDACEFMKGFAPKFSSHRFKQDNFPLGVILGTVEIVGCVKSSSSPWFVGEYGFVLRNPVSFQESIKCRGALGFWFVPEEIVLLARNEYRNVTQRKLIAI